VFISASFALACNPKLGLVFGKRRDAKRPVSLPTELLRALSACVRSSSIHQEKLVINAIQLDFDDSVILVRPLKAGKPIEAQATKRSLTLLIRAVYSAPS
jgi:hypothetical protein